MIDGAKDKQLGPVHIDFEELFKAKEKEELLLSYKNMQARANPLYPMMSLEGGGCRASLGPGYQPLISSLERLKNKRTSP